MMRRICTYNQCGTVLQISDGEGAQAQLDVLMEKHIAENHSTFEERAKPILANLRDRMAYLAAQTATPGTVSPKEARAYFTAIDTLLESAPVTNPLDLLTKTFQRHAEAVAADSGEQTNVEQVEQVAEQLEPVADETERDVAQAEGNA